MIPKQNAITYFRMILQNPFNYNITFDPLLGWMLCPVHGNLTICIDDKFANYIIRYYKRNFPSPLHS